MWLTDHVRVHAMMDLSDGLAKDLPRLARASGCGFVLERGAVPRTRGVDVEGALGDGEDYELLFTVSRRSARRLEAECTTAGGGVGGGVSRPSADVCWDVSQGRGGRVGRRLGSLPKVGLDDKSLDSLEVAVVFCDERQLG